MIGGQSTINLMNNNDFKLDEPIMNLALLTHIKNAASILID